MTKFFKNIFCRLHYLAPAIFVSISIAFAISIANAAPTYKPIFDGKTFPDWHIIGKGTWTIKDSTIIGKNTVAETQFGHLVTDKDYGDFTLRCLYKITGGNSGLYFHSVETGYSGLTGMQAEIDPDSGAGGLYEINGRAWVVQPKLADQAKWFKPNDWNEMIVSSIGTHTTVMLNGYKSAELLNDEVGRKSGKIALQLHGYKDVNVVFKDIGILDTAISTTIKSKMRVKEFQNSSNLNPTSGWTRLNGKRASKKCNACKTIP